MDNLLILIYHTYYLSHLQDKPIQEFWIDNIKDFWKKTREQGVYPGNAIRRYNDNILKIWNSLGWYKF